LGDGKILYWTNAGDAYDLIEMDSDGNYPHPMSRLLPLTLDPDACRDGHTLLFAAAFENTIHVMLQDLDGGVPQPLVEGSFPHCSPDSHWLLYYTSADDVPRRISMKGGEPVKLTEEDCVQGGISPDGNWIACVQSPDNSPKLAIVPSTGGKPAKTFDLPTVGRSVVFVVDQGDHANLWAQSISGGPPRALPHFTSEEIGNFAFSPDGKKIAIGRGTSSSDAVMIRNFH
jgi:Tol biopolymer transport system component